MSDEEFEKPVGTSTEKSQSKFVNFAFGTKETDATRMKHIGFHVVKKRSSEPENLLNFWMDKSVELFGKVADKERGEAAFAEKAQTLRQLLDAIDLSKQGEMKNFIKKHGVGILIRTLSFYSNSIHLRFVCDYVPHDLLQEALRKKNYYAVDAYLYFNSTGDEMGHFNVERQQYQHEKIKILLEVDYEGLVQYSESDDFKKYRPAVQACFMQAIHEYKQEHKLDEGYKH